MAAPAENQRTSTRKSLPMSALYRQIIEVAGNAAATSGRFHNRPEGAMNVSPAGSIEWRFCRILTTVALES